MSCPLCKNTALGGLVCSGCVSNTLYYKQQAIAYKKVALRDVFDQAKAVLSAKRPVFDQEQALGSVLRKQAELKEQLHQTAEKVRELRPSVARKKFMLEDRRRALRASIARLDDLTQRHDRRSNPVLEGLHWYKEQAKEAVHQRVWTRVLEHFVIFPIEADLPASHRPHVGGGGYGRLRNGHHAMRDHLMGVSTIGSLPLPNSGNYTALGLPDEVCEAALYLVARLTRSLANTFQVTLPHPLSFPAGKPHAMIAEDAQRRTEFVLSAGFYKKAPGGGGGTGGGAGGLERMHSSNGRSSAGGHRQASSVGGPSVAQLPNGERADPFHIGVEYLQFNVHRLAISAKVGVDSSELWGREAILLNLWAIQQHAARLVQSYRSVPDLPLPTIRKRGSNQAEIAGNTPAIPPTVVFEDREEAEWALVDFEEKRKGGGGGSGSGNSGGGGSDSSSTWS